MTTPNDEMVVQSLGGADASFLAKHPELHHYTDLQGLQGIYHSNTIRATHYSHLNDSLELAALLPALAKIWTERGLAVLRSARPHGFALSREITRKGGLQKYAKYVADLAVADVHRQTFAEDQELPPLTTPFITSFCTHSSPPEEYERAHGLLSQWRAYGRKERLCIVFDTRQLQELLLTEIASYSWRQFDLAEVVYLGTSSDDRAAFARLDREYGAFMEGIFEKSEVDFGNGYVEFMNRAPLYKHRGFREEQEVRVVAGVMTARSMAEAITNVPGFVQERPLKPVRRRPGETLKYIRYIELLGLRFPPLPILRVIVGPGPQQEENRRKAVEVLGSKVLVTLSETPFLG